MSNPTRLFVGNLSYQTGENDLQDYFAPAGTVTSVNLILDKVTGKRCTFAFFPWNWDRGDGCIIRLVAMIDKRGDYRIERGEAF